MRLDILQSLNAERAARRAAIVITDIATGAQRFVPAADITADPLRDRLEPRLRSGKSGMEETPEGRVFLTVLERDCFYIGALGSKKTHASRLARLKAQGATDDALARIHAPIGLAIGAASPPEIAVSIMAEITAALRLPA
jgi:hypothetical protein